MNNFIELFEELSKYGIYFHMTTMDYGDMVEFTPRKPHCAVEGEPDDPRICVSPSLAGCLVAGSFRLKFVDNIFVYATTARAHAISDDLVFDAEVTEEHWIEEAVIFTKVGTIDGAKVPELAMDEMDHVAFPYDAREGEVDEYGENTSYGHHMAAKDVVEDEMGSIFQEIEKEAKMKFKDDVIPRIEDIPGQGKFYFAEEESDRSEEMYNSKEEEPALAEAEEIPDGAIKIKSVPAPGNFHKTMCKLKRKSDEE